MIDFLLQDQNWVLLLTATIAGLLLSRPLWGTMAAGSNAITTAEAVRLMNREKGVLIDISEPDTYAKAHAAGAKNISYTELKTNPLTAGLPSNKSWPVILVCERGATSAKLVAKVRQAGYEKAYTLTGGLNAWRDAQLPLVSSNHPKAT
jgi:rhodanese-related sulfurtransferase